MLSKRFHRIQNKVQLAERAKAVACVLVAALCASGCAHKVKIESTPAGATIYVDGEEKGTTPVILVEQPGCFAHRDLRVELPGHVPVETKLEQSELVWYVIAPSVCLACPTFGLSCFGLKYATQYGQEYEYRLSPKLEDGNMGEIDLDEKEKTPEDGQQTIPY